MHAKTYYPSDGSTSRKAHKVRPVGQDEQMGMEVMPNPANNTTVIYYRSKSNIDVVNIVLTDVNGQKVFSQFVNGGNGKFELPTNNLSNGIYNVMLQSSNGSFATQKLIINH